MDQKVKIYDIALMWNGTIKINKTQQQKKQKMKQKLLINEDNHIDNFCVVFFVVFFFGFSCLFVEYEYFSHKTTYN